MSSVILAQTDTTVGFLSQNANKLFEIKSRDTKKKFIKIYPSLLAFTKTKRVPNSKKNLVRRAKKTTFIVKDEAFRIVTLPLHSQVLRNLSWYYSTSANETNKHFDYDFCTKKADIIIEDSNGFCEKEPSTLLKINQIKKRKLR